MATKSYTDLEQSKKLAKILPITNIDFAWCIFSNGSTRLLPMDDWEVFEYAKSNVEIIPCFSLAALLSVLPNKIVSHETAFEGEDAKGITDIYYKCIESTEDDRYMCRYVGNGYMYECVADNPIDTCYEMILKLHESKIL